MADHKPQVPAEQDNPEVTHEYSDVNVRAIVKFGLGLAGFLLVAHLAVLWLLDHFTAQEKRDRGTLPPFVEKDRTRLPRDVDRIPRPRLERNDTTEISRLRREEDARLHSYGWVDAKAQVVRIPIERAMDLLLEKK